MLADNYKKVLENIHNACNIAQRKIDTVTLLAVSKYQHAQSLAEIAMLGQKHFGENYLKEAKEKRIELQTLLPEEIYNKLQWHSIGHIQTNKAKDACDNYFLLHTVDSEKLALSLDKVLARKLQMQDILLEVNIANEEQKAGVSALECPKLIEKILSIPSLNIKGFMCLPPFQTKEGENRKHFRAVYELKVSMEKEFGMEFPHLSMGTSSDYKEAILEGATFVRVGTDIFGERKYSKE